MARVKRETIEAIQEKIDSLPEEHVNTCGLCNRTLHDELTVISVQTGAPEMTVVREFAKRYNDGKRPEEQITPNAFKERIKYLRKVNQKELSGETHRIEPDDSEDVSKDDIKEDEPTLQDDAGESDEQSQISGESHQISEQEENEEETKEISYLLPETLNQHELVDSLCHFFSSKQVPSDKIYRTFLLVLDRLCPLEANNFRKGHKILFEDLNKVISHRLRVDKKHTKQDIANQLLGGLNGSGLSDTSVEEIVTKMTEEVWD